MKNFSLFLFISVLLFSFNSCYNNKERKINTVSEKSTSSPKKILGIDLQQIKERGELRALTIHSPSSYFLYKGKSMGFEYDLLKNFANHIGVDFKIVIVEDIDDMIPMLQSGKGDIIAHGLTITKDRAKLVSFTDHYNVTNQVLVQRKPHKWWQMRQDDIDDALVKDVVELIGKKVSIRKETSYYDRLENLMHEIGDTIYIDIINGEFSTEEIIKKVSDGEIDYTIADKYIAEINKSYYSNIDVSTKISLSQRIAWAVRKDSPELKKAINEWLKSIKKQSFYNVTYTKYFKNKRQFNKSMKSDFSSLKSGRISKYDDIVKKYSEAIGWDWMLVSSIIYQESRFNHNAKSWVGAKGLMQIMPSTALELGVKNDTPSENIKAGTKYLKQIYDRFDDVPNEIERIKFTIASYNCGYGHIKDAQRLADINGKDRNSWDNGVGESLLKLSRAKYYNLKGIHYGYVRGIEPYNYVNEIFERYKSYRSLLK